MALRFDPKPMVKARVELGLTQEEAARAIGVDVRTLRRYESGEVNARGFASNRSSRRAIVARIARELGVDESELLVDTDAPSAPARAEDAGHALPRPRVFEGRGDLVARVSSVLRGEGARVFALVGLGGAGKTAVVAAALASLDPASRRRVFAWSFYEDPRVEAFLEALRRAAVVAVVLDGFEVLQSDGRTGRARGEVEDGRIRNLLRGSATGRNAFGVVVTTRFDLSGVDDAEGVESVALPPLTEDEAARVLRGWGLTGDVDRLARATGGHALSAAMLGSYARTVFEGDASRVASVDLREAASVDVFARRLASVLDGLASALSPLERDVLACVSIFPRGVALPSLERLAGHGLGGALPALRGARAASIAQAVGALVRRGLAVRAQPDRVTTHPILREHFRGLLEGDPRLVHDAERRALAREMELSRSLEQRPNAAPQRADELDAYERLLEHTLWAGEHDAAADILYRSLGGFSHLGLRLGAFERGLRMARSFADTGGLAGVPRPRDLSAALSPAFRMRVAYEWGLYEAALGDLEAALDAYAESNRVALEIGDTTAFVTGLRTTAYTHRLRGEGAEARGAIDRSLRLADELELTHALVRGLALSGAIFADAGEIGPAKAEFARARALGDRPFARRAIWEAEVHLAAGDIPFAAHLLEATVAGCRAIGWRGHEAHAQVLLGEARLREDPPAVDAARAHLAAARAWTDETGEVELRLTRLLLEARVARVTGEDREADRSLSELRALAARGGFGWFLDRARALEGGSAAS